MVIIILFVHRASIVRMVSLPVKASSLSLSQKFLAVKSKVKRSVVDSYIEVINKYGLPIIC